MNSLFILVALGAVAFVIKALGSRDADVKGTPIFPKEAFPEIEMPVLDKSEYLVTDALEKEKNHKHVNPSTKYKRTSVPSVENKKEQISEVAKNKSDFSLRNKSEAKRAFVYSEILNRKY